MDTLSERSPLMSFRRIEYFLSVAKHLNFTKAARECYVAQAAISQQIKHCSRRHVCSHLRLRYQSVLRFLPGRSGKAEADRNSGGTQKGKASEDRPALLRSSYPECDEGQHRALPGRRDHRRIYRCTKRPGIPDHLRKPDIQTYMGPDVHCDPLHHCHATVFCTLSY